MEKQDIVNRVVQTVVQVQEASGRASGAIDVTTRPLRDMEGFDSLSGLEATVLLSESLGVDIPDTCNPFISEDGNRALSVSEIADTINGYIVSEAMAK